MPPNTVEIANAGDVESVTTQKVPPGPVELAPESKSSSKIFLCLSTLNTIVHLLTGMIVGVTLIFALTLNRGPTATHIIMCTIGYQLLMAESVLVLCPQNGWSASLSLVNKRRVHWVLQIMGSVLVIAGSVILSMNKPVNWNTMHGKFALVAMVFTTVSLVNGLSSLYAYELRKVLPGILSKLTHICFGTVAFTAACVSLCYGYDKNSFRNWTTPELAQTMIGITGAFNLIIIISPLIAFSDKLVNSFKNK